MTEIARVADWLDKAHADRDLSARCCRMAYSLARAADEHGFISSNALAKIARGDHASAAAAEPFADVLGRLAERGYLQACGRRRIDGFRLTASTVAPSSAAITPFPSARRTGFIRKHAQHMATLTPTHSEGYLRHQMKIQSDTMRRHGVAEDAIAREIKSLESSIRSELWRVVLLPDQPSGPA
jgi:Family of unknown function (DUF6074)